MHTASKVVIGIGIVVIIIGIIVITTAGSGFEEQIEEGIIYEGADGEVTIETETQNEGARYIVHLVDVKYVGGSTCKNQYLQASITLSVTSLSLSACYWKR